MLSANWIINKLIAEQNDLEEWPTTFHLVRSSYHGGDYEGNAIRRLLRPDSLKELLRRIERANPDFKAGRQLRSARLTRPIIFTFYDILTSFATVVFTSFGMDLRAGWQPALHHFTHCLQQLPGDRRLPVKFHAISAHVEDVCLKRKAGLSSVSEQSLESAHHDYIRLWNSSYRINDVTNPRYREALMKCTLQYNARHIPMDHLISLGRGNTLGSTGAPNCWQGPTSRKVCSRVTQPRTHRHPHTQTSQSLF